MTERIKKYSFLFSVLVKRDFNKKYNRTILGAFWSLLQPMLMVAVQAMVFTHLFGRTTPHYIPYIFIGNIVYSFFRQATVEGMQAIESNAGIVTKIRVPKYLFIFSKNIVALINFLLTFVVFILVCLIDRVDITWRWLLLPYPLLCLSVFNIGASLFLSGVFVFFRDTRYLYDILCTMIMYLSAIFYTVTSFPTSIQWLFNINPVFAYISYFRKLLIYANLPSIQHTLLCFGYALAMLGFGALFYIKFNKVYVYNL